MQRFDVIIVGARCAGSALAVLLAQRGMRVCVVDRARFPSDTPSTHGIQPCGVTILRRLGVLDELLAVSTPIERGLVRLDDVRIDRADVPELLGAPMLNARRMTLDAILLAAAAAAGAQVRTETAVTGLLTQDGRVIGVRTRAGPLGAPLVVGADGSRSTVARLVGAREYCQTPAGRLFAWAYFAGARDPGCVWLGKIGDHGFLASPTDGGLFMAAIAPSLSGKAELLGDLRAGYARGLHGWPELDACLAGAERIGSIRVVSRWHGFFRESAGPGWVLVGDAGHFKDPTPGQGISDALRQAARLASAIEEALGGSDFPDTILRLWWAWRDRDAWEMYWFARDLGAPGPTSPVVRQIQRRIAAHPGLTDNLLRVFNHDLPPSKLINPGLALAATANAWTNSPGHRAHVLREACGLVSGQLRRRYPPRRLQHAKVEAAGSRSAEGNREKQWA
jgi:2-polyprenyl-6-methoxyphenol hydroxylase-like FAD-dependent oxidoreductase